MELSVSTTETQQPISAQLIFRSLRDFFPKVANPHILRPLVAVAQALSMS